MQKVVLITGSSSGIGKATAILFANKGWGVIATMRSPRDEAVLTEYENVYLDKLDITDNESITICIDEALRRHGRIDAIINNAGYGLFGPVEGMTADEINKEFHTNVIGLVNVTRAVLPHMRENRSGTIVNISSMLGLMTLPFSSMYASTKWAVEGFSEALAFEMEPHNVRVRLIEPGTIKTNFFNSEIRVPDDRLGDYGGRFNNVMKGIDAKGASGASAESVAIVIWKAINSKNGRLRYTVDPTSKFLTNLHRFVPASVYRKIITKAVG